MLTVHHLDYSRSTRVVWLLEELNMDYRLVRYPRPAGGPAPDTLKAIHPLGRSPVIEDDAFVLAESSAILRYLDACYGGYRFTPQDVRERARHDEWLDFVEGSIATPLIVPLVVGGALSAPAREGFSTQLDKALGFVGDALATRNHLMGDQLTLADIQMSYVVAVASATGALAAHPTIEAYLQRLMGRPALARAVAAGGPMV